MRILIAGSVQGDGSYEEETLCRCIKKELDRLGHTTDLFLLPYGRNVLSLPEQILAYRLLQINDCELLITVGYPACMLRHHNKVCYLLQTEPMLLEYWDSAYGVLANYQYSQIIIAVRQMEQAALSQARRVFCCSKQLAGTLRERYELSCETLLYPPMKVGLPVSSGDLGESYVLCESALLPWQREGLLLELAEHIPVRLYVSNAEPIYLETVDRRIKEKNLEDKLLLVRRRASGEEIDRAAWLFFPDYSSNRISNLAVWGAEKGKPLVAMEDCGALSELIVRENLLRREQLKRAACGEMGFSVAAISMVDGRSFVEELLRG